MSFFERHGEKQDKKDDRENKMEELQIGAARHLVSSYINYFISRGKEGDETEYASAVYNMLNEASDNLVELGVTKNESLFIDHAKILSTLNHFLYVLNDPINNWNTVLERNDLSSEKAIGKISIELASEFTAQFIEYWLGKNKAAQYAGAVNTILCETCDWFIKQGLQENDSRFINYAIILITISSSLYGKGEQDTHDQWNILLDKHGLLPDNPVLSEE